MRVLLTGGGTMGSVTPLLAIAPELRDRGDQIFFVGTRKGPERQVVEAAGIPFTAIASTKLRRYVSLWHVLLPFQLFAGVMGAWRVLRRIRPDVIVSAGSFVDVPVVWVGRLLGIPAMVHQQDIHPGLAVRLVARWASAVTVTFEQLVNHFPGAIWVGNPVRDLTPTTETFELDPNVPTVLVMGGGTGAQAMNELVTTQLCERANVIHVTGRGREGNMENISHPRYHKHVFLLEELKEGLHAATVVVSRAGIGSITELAKLGKPSIIIPMPDSHQEHNAELLENAGAATILQQKDLDANAFAAAVHDLLADPKRQNELSQAIQSLLPAQSNQRFIDVLDSIVST